MSDLSTSRDERVLVLAPTAGAAALSRTILADADLECQVCTDLASLCRGLAAGAGAILLTEDALAPDALPSLSEALGRQPAWSDVPVLLPCGSGADSPRAAWAMGTLSNVTVLERPVRVTTLVSVLRTALKARRRQYELRDQLESLRNSEASLRDANERLELLWETAAVLLSTDEPDAMLRGLFEKIGPRLQLDIYFNFMVDEGGDALRLQSYTGLPEDVARSIARLDFGQAVCGTVAARRRPAVVPFVQRSDDPKAQLVKRLGVRAYACNPLMAGDRLLGTLSFASRSRDQFDPHEVAFLETITHYVTIAYERMQFIEALREDDRRKDEFLATLAHELRNPLAPIRTGLELLKLGGHDRALVEEVQATMERQVRQMIHLVDDLMDVSRITRGKLDLRRCRVELAAVVRGAIEATRGFIDESRHSLSVALPDQSLFLDADPTRLSQIVSNLLNNAAKYTPERGSIRLAAERQGSDVVVSVRDDGVGIPAEMLDRIFDMFTQVDRSLERGSGGLGIGLTLVKSLTEMHGGSVEARSEGRGRGSEFLVRLPLRIEPPAPEPSTEAGRGEAATGRLRILVVDDNREGARLLGMIVTMLGHDLRTAHDGLEAIEVAAAYRPDVVLMDIGMPRLNGYDAARRMREQPWGREPRLVALTGWGQDEDKQRAREAGFDRHFVKPVEPAALQSLLAELQPARD
jgi:signal transduction histidine kinase